MVMLLIIQNGLPKNKKIPGHEIQKSKKPKTPPRVIAVILVAIQPAKLFLYRPQMAIAPLKITPFSRIIDWSINC